MWSPLVNVEAADPLEDVVTTVVAAAARPGGVTYRPFETLSLIDEAVVTSAAAVNPFPSPESAVSAAAAAVPAQIVSVSELSSPLNLNLSTASAGPVGTAQWTLSTMESPSESDDRASNEGVSPHLLPFHTPSFVLTSLKFSSVIRGC